MVYPYEFEGEIERFGVGKDRKIWYDVLFLPQALRNVLPFAAHPRLRVEGEIAEASFSGAFIPAGDGRNYAIVSPAIRKDAGVGIGDVVVMRFRIADQDQVDMPPALSAALAEDALRRGTWDALTPGKRRALAQHVASARTPATCV